MKQAEWSLPGFKDLIRDETRNDTLLNIQQGAWQVTDQTNAINDKMGPKMHAAHSYLAKKKDKKATEKRVAKQQRDFLTEFQSAYLEKFQRSQQKRKANAETDFQTQLDELHQLHEKM